MANKGKQADGEGRCSRCDAKAEISLPGTGCLCGSCFDRVFVKRVRKRIRLGKFFSKGDMIVVEDELCMMLLKSILKGLPVKYIRNNEKESKGNRVRQVSALTMDDMNYAFLSGIFSGKKAADPMKGKVAPLAVVTDAEAVLFASRRGIKFLPAAKEKAVCSMIESLESRYPEMRFSLFQSVRKITGWQ